MRDARLPPVSPNAMTWGFVSVSLSNMLHEYSYELIKHQPRISRGFQFPAFESPASEFFLTLDARAPSPGSQLVQLVLCSANSLRPEFEEETYPCGPASPSSPPFSPPPPPVPNSKFAHLKIIRARHTPNATQLTIRFENKNPKLRGFRRIKDKVFVKFRFSCGEECISEDIKLTTKWNSTAGKDRRGLQGAVAPPDQHHVVPLPERPVVHGAFASRTRHAEHIKPPVRAQPTLAPNQNQHQHQHMHHRCCEEKRSVDEVKPDVIAVAQGDGVPSHKRRRIEDGCGASDWDLGVHSRLKRAPSFTRLSSEDIETLDALDVLGVEEDHSTSNPFPFTWTKSETDMFLESCPSSPYQFDGEEDRPAPLCNERMIDPLEHPQLMALGRMLRAPRSSYSVEYLRVVQRELHSLLGPMSPAPLVVSAKEEHGDFSERLDVRSMTEI